MGLNPISWLLPSTAVSFHHSAAPISLALKKSSSTDKGTASKQHVSLSDLCKEATPDKCQLNPLLFNGHLQTAYTVVKNIDVPIYYKRKLFEADNAVYRGQFAIDFVVEPYDKEAESEKANADDDTEDTAAYNGQTNKDLPTRTSFYTDAEFASLPSNDTKPMLVALHGLSGGSHELYLRHVLSPLVKSGGDGDGGWEACVVNSRGCAQSKITTGVLYNARATWDVRQAVRWLREKFPNRPLFGIGFSLGANILTNVRIIDSGGEIVKTQKRVTRPVRLFRELNVDSNSAPFYDYSTLVKKARIVSSKAP
jgi:predicted alpha/beta-fold hydrolase